VRFTTNGVCSKTYNHIYVARTNEDLSPYICNVCELLSTNYCMPTRWLTGPLQKMFFPAGSNLWLRNWLWGGGTFWLAPGWHFPMSGPWSSGLISLKLTANLEIPKFCYRSGVGVLKSDSVHLSCAEMSIGLDSDWTGSRLLWILLILDWIRAAKCSKNLGSGPDFDWVNGKQLHNFCHQKPNTKSFTPKA